MQLYLLIPGEPMAKQRPRVTRQGVAYTPAQTVNYETLVKEMFYTTYPNHKPMDGPVKVRINAYFTIPASWSKKKQQSALIGNMRPTGRKDWDNIGKIVTDALNRIAYMDDGQIVDGRVCKHYTDVPRVEVYIEEA